MSAGIFSIARTALLTHQVSLQTISQNIANAETPGYSRQEAQLVANTPVRFPYGVLGTGVNVAAIIRHRDILLDDGYRSSSASLGNAETRRESLSRVEQVFGEPSDLGMSNALDQFWGSWSDLSASPGNDAARAVVQQRGKQVASLFNSYDRQLSDQRSGVLERVATNVGEINRLAQQVAGLNDQILRTEGGNITANDLRDQRDIALDSLSRLAGTRSIWQNNGSVTVLIGNSTLVDASTARPISLGIGPTVPPPAVAQVDMPVSIRLGDSPDMLWPLGGELDAAIGVVNKQIPLLRSRLDAMATGIVTAVNSIHTAGFVFSGNSIPGTAAGNFFDVGTLAAPVRAGSLKLDAAVAANIANIAASGDASAPTDNNTALALSALRTVEGSVSFTDSNGTTELGSFLGFFRNTVTKLGLDVRNAEDDSAVYSALAEQAEQRRQSVSGVNTDEELIKMLKAQQSYTAATKLIKTADEMLQTLLQLI